MEVRPVVEHLIAAIESGRPRDRIAAVAEARRLLEETERLGEDARAWGRELATAREAFRQLYLGYSGERPLGEGEKRQ